MIYCVHQDSGCQSWKSIILSLKEEGGRGEKGGSKKRKKEERKSADKQKGKSGSIDLKISTSQFFFSFIHQLQLLLHCHFLHMAGSCQADILKGPQAKRKRLSSLNCGLKKPQCRTLRKCTNTSWQAWKVLYWPGLRSEHPPMTNQSFNKNIREKHWNRGKKEWIFKDQGLDKLIAESL